jgi:hypothetical protein
LLRASRLYLRLLALGARQSALPASNHCAIERGQLERQPGQSLNSNGPATVDAAEAKHEEQ